MIPNETQQNGLPSYAKDYNFEKRKGRMEFALRQAGTNEFQIAQSMKLSQASLNQYKNEKNKRFQKLNELAQVLGVNPMWLHSGEGSPFHGTPKDPKSIGFVDIEMDEAYYTNYFNKKYPGKDCSELKIQISASDYEKLNSSFLSYILMPDDSMQDEIMYSSIVIIDRNDTYIENGKLYAVSFYDEVTIRRTYRINKDVVLKPNKKDVYEDQTIERNDQDSSGLNILGKVKLVKNYYI